MISYVWQSLLLIIFISSNVELLKPPGYVAPSKEYDPHPPKYQYGYKIQDNKSIQGKDEERDGIYAQGRYYVDKGPESNQSVKYFADDWGFHPVVEYSNTSPHSRSSANFVLGHEAIKLKNNQKSIPTDPNDPGRAQNLIDPSKIVPTVLENSPQILVQQPVATVQLNPVISPQPTHSNALQLSPAVTPTPLSTNDPNDNTVALQPSQPLIYYIQQPQSAPLLLPNQQQIIPLQQVQQTSPVQLQPIESLPQPQALILPQNNGLASPGNLYFINNPQLSTPRSDIVDNSLPNLENNQIKLPVQQPLVTSTEPSTRRLIDSTRNLVTGADVLKINSAIPNRNLGLDSNIIEPLLNKYITPIVSTTTIRPIESTTATIGTTSVSLLKEPIIAAETVGEDIDNKPVTEKTEENQESFATTARNEVVNLSTTTGEPSGEVVVTPRPVSSKFLAPITAGIQLQTIEEGNKLAADIELEQEIEEEEKETLEKQKVLVQVQKTVPYYLGMYQYPELIKQTGIDQIAKNDQKLEEKVAADLELGKSLLYSPGIASPRAEQLILKSQNKLENLKNDQLVVQTGEQQIVVEGTEKTKDRNEQKIINQSYQVQVPVAVPYPVIKQVPVAIEKIVEKPVPYPQSFPVEKIIDRPVHVPIEITKYVDRLYPVEVPVPYPQHYPVEKVVKQPYPVEVRVPVPVEKVVEQKVPVPYYIDRPVDKSLSQAYLVHIPGIFSQQKYSSLVQQPYPSQNLYKQLDRSKEETQRFVTNYLYAPQVNHYLTPHQANTGRRLSSKYKKLNLLIFPGNNVNHYPLDLQAGETYRYSKAKLNNGYLPPPPSNNKECQNSEQETAASISNKSYTTIRFNNDHNKNNIELEPSKFDSSKNKYRSGRMSGGFDEKSIRMEYGFKPPLIPSIEIDEQGRPIGKN